DLEDRVREIDERLELVVTLGGGAAVEFDRVGVAQHEGDRAAGRDRHAIQLDAGHRVAALRYQVLYIDFGRNGRREGARAVGGGDVIPARRVERGRDLRDLDLEV